MFGTERKCIRRRDLKPGKVAVISGGGAGHEPMHVGFVGHGMLDAACAGHIFTSPTPDQIVSAIAETDTGAGCLLIVKNYDGDVMNFEMAAEMRLRPPQDRDGRHLRRHRNREGQRAPMAAVAYRELWSSKSSSARRRKPEPTLMA